MIQTIKLDDPLSQNNSRLIAFFDEVSRWRELTEIMQWANTPLTVPSRVSQRDFLRFDSIIADCLPEEVQMMELSPVNPIGLNTFLSETSQKKILSTIRSTEVLSDVTTALALYSSLLRKSQSNQHSIPTHLASSHRQLRTQNYSRNKLFLNHFRVLGMVTWFRRKNVLEEEFAQMIYHIKCYLDIICSFRDKWLSINDIKIKVWFPNYTRKIIERRWLKVEELIKQGRETSGWIKFNSSIFNIIWLDAQSEYSLDEIGPDHIAGQEWLLNPIYVKRINELVHESGLDPDLFTIRTDRLSWINYYDNLFFSIHAVNGEWNNLCIVDWWVTNRASKILNNNKEANLISGLWTEFTLANYK